MTIEQNLTSHGIELPTAIATQYAYSPVAINGSTLQLAGHLAKTAVAQIRHQGAVGSSTSLESATEDAGLCVLQGLSSIKQELGSLDRLSHPMHLNVYVAVSHGFTDISPIADGASSMLLKAFGQKHGRHPRSVIGVSVLPRDAPVMIDLSFALLAG